MKKISGPFIALVVLLCGLSVSLTIAQDSTKSKKLLVSEAKLGREINDKVLGGEDSTFALNSKVFLWLKIAGGSSDSVIVTWKHGDYTYRTVLNVGGSPWRTWAAKTAMASGEWAVTVTDSEGNILKELKFKVE